MALDPETMLLYGWLVFIGMILSACISRVMHRRATHQLWRENDNLRDQYGQLREKHVDVHFELKYIFHTIETQSGQKLSDDRDTRMAEIRELFPDFGPGITIN